MNLIKSRERDVEDYQAEDTWEHASIYLNVKDFCMHKHRMMPKAHDLCMNTNEQDGMNIGWSNTLPNNRPGDQ